MNYYSPLRYPGGKISLFNFVSNLIVENNYSNTSYAEPYAGGCGLALKLLFEEIVEEIYLNDFDYFVYSFWNVILEQTNEFCNWIESVNVDIDSWHDHKTILSNPAEYTQFELAKATFFLNRTNISGVLKGGVIGGKNQTGKYKIDARFNRTDLIKRIELISSKKNAIHLSNLDALDFLNSINNVNPVFVYLDPPYYKKGSELYLNFYKKQNHQELFEFLKIYNKDFIISYDNNEFIKTTYQNFDIYKFNISQSTSNKIGNEIVIFSSELKYRNSLKFIKSPQKITTKHRTKKHLPS